MLAAIMEERDTSMDLRKIFMVKDYPTVFPEELLGIPPDREVEFRINLIHSTSPIFKTPYKMAPTEMVELKKQLQEL